MPVRCPHCSAEIHYVICTSKYYQRQTISPEGKLIHEYDDIDEAIGETISTDCPECWTSIQFTRDGRLPTKPEPPPIDISAI